MYVYIYDIYIYVNVYICMCIYIYMVTHRTVFTVNTTEICILGGSGGWVSICVYIYILKKKKHDYYGLYNKYHF